MRHLPQPISVLLPGACLLLLLALPALGTAKDHQHDIDRAKLAADLGEPARAKYILKQALRKDPKDPALKQAMEELLHPPKATATPTAVPTPKPQPTAKPAPKAAKAKPQAAEPKPAKAPKAKAAPEPTAIPAAKAKPAPAAAAAEPQASLGSRIKAKLKSWLPGWGRHPAPPPPVVKETPLPCRTVTYIYFGKTRTGKLLRDLPRSAELMVSYNKGKLKIARDQVVKIVDCL